MSDKKNNFRDITSSVDLVAEMERVIRDQAQRRAQESSTRIAAQAIGQAQQVLNLTV